MWFLRKRKAMLGEEEIQRKSSWVQREIWSLTSVKKESRGAGWCDATGTLCCGREAILGASQPQEKAVAAILSGQQGGNRDLTGKCCRKIWEKGIWTGACRQPEGKAGCWLAGGMVYPTVSHSPLRGTTRLLAEQLPTTAASRGMEEGWGVGVPPHAHFLLQHGGGCKCWSAFCSALFPALLFFPGCSCPCSVPPFRRERRTRLLPGQGLSIMEGSRRPKSG